MEQLISEGAEIAVIGYHINDPYQNNYGLARAEYYGMAAFPHVVLDGQQLFEWTYDDILSAYEERIDEDSHYSIELLVDRYATDVNVTVNVGQIGAPNPETKVLHLVLTESYIEDSWYGGEYINHTERLMIPDHNGTPLTGDIDFEFQMEESWKPQNCELIAFVQDTVTKEVVQSTVFHLEETVLNNDVALTEIIVPGEEYCLDSVNPVIKFKNMGVDTLKSFVVYYMINGNPYNYE